jgi:hypothetical protein
VQTIFHYLLCRQKYGRSYDVSLVQRTYLGKVCALGKPRNNSTKWLSLGVAVSKLLYMRSEVVVRVNCTSYLFRLNLATQAHGEVHV